jgi:hypothetical protein
MGMLDYAVHRKPETLIKTKLAIMAGEGPRWIRNSKRARYIAQVVLSTPPWVDRAALRAIQARARALSEMSGVEQHIAHVIPLNHPRVCGLTVPWNLEIKPAKVNLAESNHVHLDEQLALFD